MSDWVPLGATDEGLRVSGYEDGTIEVETAWSSAAGSEGIIYRSGIVIKNLGKDVAAITLPPDIIGRERLARAILGDPDAVIISSDELPTVTDGDTFASPGGAYTFDASLSAIDYWAWARLYIAMARQVERREQTA